MLQYNCSPKGNDDRILLHTYKHILNIHINTIVYQECNCSYLLQILQCFDLMGFLTKHVLQNTSELNPEFSASSMIAAY